MPVFAALILLIFVAGPAGAQDIDKGKEAAWRGDYTAALAEFRPLAEQGNAEAQYNLANLYRDGHGVSDDGDQAVIWYQRAAESGSWSAALDLGMLYWGQNLNGDHKESTRGGGLVRAHMWLGIAAATEDGRCAEVSAPLHTAIAQSMTEEQIVQAQELTRAWLAEHKPTDVNIATAQPAC